MCMHNYITHMFVKALKQQVWASNVIIIIFNVYGFSFSCYDLGTT